MRFKQYSIGMFCIAATLSLGLAGYKSSGTGAGTDY